MPSFDQQIDNWARRAEQKLELAFRKIALEAFTRVVLRSPVDTGRFRGNWQVTVGQSADWHPDSQLDPSGTITIADVNEHVFNLKLGQTIWLANGLPYARRLEYGWSDQAPGGMVRITALEFDPIVKQVVDQIRSMP